MLPYYSFVKDPYSPTRYRNWLTQPEANGPTNVDFKKDASDLVPGLGHVNPVAFELKISPADWKVTVEERFGFGNFNTKSVALIDISIIIDYRIQTCLTLKSQVNELAIHYDRGSTL